MMPAKALLILCVTDGTYVLKPKELHVKGRPFRKEAGTLFARLFGRGPHEPCVRTEARETLREIAGFKLPEVFQDLPEFQDSGFRWHPVVMRLDKYCFSWGPFLECLHERFGKDLPVDFASLMGHQLEDRIRKKLAACPDFSQPAE